MQGRPVPCLRPGEGSDPPQPRKAEANAGDEGRPSGSGRAAHGAGLPPKPTRIKLEAKEDERWCRPWCRRLTAGVPFAAPSTAGAASGSTWSACRVPVRPRLGPWCPSRAGRRWAHRCRSSFDGAHQAAGCAAAAAASTTLQAELTKQKCNIVLRNLFDRKFIEEQGHDITTYIDEVRQELLDDYFDWNPRAQDISKARDLDKEAVNMLLHLGCQISFKHALFPLESFKNIF